MSVRILLGCVLLWCVMAAGPMGVGAAVVPTDEPHPVGSGVDECQVCQAFIRRLEDEGCHLLCDALPPTERVICRVLLVPDVCEKLIQQLTLHRSDPLHVCGRLGLCTKGCPCGRCTAQTRGHCLAEEADRCAQPRSPRASAQQPAQPAKPTQACPAGACGDVNTTDCCLHC
eukprot:EG_transcript_25126